MTVTGPKFPAAFPASRVAIAMAIAERFGWVEGHFGTLCRAPGNGGEVLAESIHAAADAMHSLGWSSATRVTSGFRWDPCTELIPADEASAATSLAKEVIRPGRWRTSS